MCSPLAWFTKDMVKISAERAEFLNGFCWVALPYRAGVDFRSAIAFGQTYLHGFFHWDSAAGIVNMMIVAHGGREYLVRYRASATFYTVDL